LAIALLELIERATAGKILDRNRVFRPSWFYPLIEDPFWLWCEYHAPSEAQFDETTAFNRYRMQLGNEWEETYVSNHFPAAHVIQSRRGEAALRETLEAMLRGESAISGGALWLLGEDIYGRADILVRCDDRSSDLGTYHYRVKEVKNSKEVKEYHQLQAAVYNWMLGEIQGFTPTSFDVVLREGEDEVNVAHYSMVPQVDELLAQWRAIRDEELQLEPIGYDSTKSPWRKYANQIVLDRRDNTLLPGVTVKKASDWRKLGIMTLDDILAGGPDGDLGRTPQSDYYCHALAYDQNRPVFRPGESAQIERKPRQVHFDVEDTSVLDSKFVTRPHTYMVGVATPDGKTTIWTAHGQDDEARMWTDFLDWLGDPREVALYCWTMYESRKLNQAATDYPALADRLLAAQAALIDLKEEIKHRPYFPVTSYSIKKVAPVCGFQWSQDDVDGQSAQLMYRDWLKTGDDSIIRRVEQYNREDVLAMVAVDNYVSGLPTEI
jgi:predicted RecB family nuclease